MAIRRKDAAMPVRCPAKPRQDADPSSDLHSQEIHFVFAQRQRTCSQPMLERQLADTRILVVGLPRLLGGVMSGIMAGYSGLQIIGEVSAKDMLNAIATLHPNVVVLGSEAGATDAHIALIRKNHPQMRVVSIDAEGRSATAHEPGNAARRVTDISPDTLLEMLRGLPG